MTSAIVSSGPIGTRAWSTISPWSASATASSRVTPVWSSPFTIAQTVGEKPRYSGSRESWKTKAPSRIRPQTSIGTSRRQLTISSRSASSTPSSEVDSRKRAFAAAAPRARFSTKAGSPPSSRPQKTSSPAPGANRARAASTRRPRSVLQARTIRKLVAVEADRLPDGEGRPGQAPAVDPGQVLADDPEREQLGAGEDGDDRGQEGEARHRGAHQDVAAEHVGQRRQAEQREAEADQARDLQGPAAEGRDQVQRVEGEPPSGG